ncbi:uncharacterized methyltransferase At2g41040, chloroplastic-like isoform X2 [Coffea arabica]|uniref:Uncharacterized methyltransferase At2g41040, chloroplastic-like isoform X2 n=1 Tax=Coffea arabica TaxID=13443 RepID=A0ABM4UMT0_COFAR
MAAVAFSPWMIGVQDRFPLDPKCPFFPYNSLSHPPLRCSSPQQFRQIIRATSAVALEPEAQIESKEGSKIDLFACPICYDPLVRKGPSGFNLSPLVSFLYERGWRQNFNRSGFPGPDDEFKMAQEYFQPVEGGVLVDVSCGSGLFSRKFAKSGTYSKVVALDFSENMLLQCYDFIKSDDSMLNSNLALVRADISRLPFPSGSVDGVHAGAALHCWPSPSNAVAEINRILRSGGVFVGTTFLRFSSSTPAFLRPLRQAGRNYNYLTKEEIEDVCTSCGLINYTSKVQQSFIMFSAQKP